MTNAPNDPVNPYITGRLTNYPDEMFGRESVLKSINDHLNTGTQFLLLHGQRCIGKSSVLQSIPHYIPPQNRFSFVNFNLHKYDNSSLSNSDIIRDLAETIKCDLELRNTTLLNPENLEEKKIFFNYFLEQVFQHLGDNKNLVLLLDEFEGPYSGPNLVNKDDDFYYYLRSLIYENQKLFMIAAVGRFKDDLKNLFKSLINPQIVKVDLLNDKYTRQLITQPPQEILIYEDDAINAIYQLSSGHPYFIQVICFTLFVQVKRIENRCQVTYYDVESIVDKAINSAESGLESIWEGLEIYDRVVLLTLAKAESKIINEELFKDTLFTQLRISGVYEKCISFIEIDKLMIAIYQLEYGGFLADYSLNIKIDFFRRWLIKSHSLIEIIQYLPTDNLNITNTMGSDSEQSENQEHEKSEVSENHMNQPPNDNNANSLSSLINLFREKPWTIFPVLLILALFVELYFLDIIKPPKKDSNILAKETQDTLRKVTVNLFCKWRNQGRLNQPIQSAIVTANSVRTGNPINVPGGIDTDGRISFNMNRKEEVQINIRHPDIRDSQLRIPKIKINESDSELEKQDYTVRRDDCYFDAKESK